MKRILSTAVLIMLLLVSFTPVKGESINIESEAAILIDRKSGQILYEKNMDKSYYPASITKIMTIYLGVKGEADLSKYYAASREAIDLVPKDTSNIALDYGEEITLRDALYGAMLMSANDASNLIAEAVSGSVEEFVHLMNTTAKSFGARNTNFVNANGLNHKDHYSTAYDFAMITKNALDNEEFKKIFCAKAYSIGSTNKKDEKRNFVAQHRMVHWAQYQHLNVKGGKTGYTKESMYTLVTYGQREDRELICVILKSPSFNAVYSDTEKLLEYGYNGFKEERVRGEDISPYVDGLTTYTATGECSFLIENEIEKEALVTTFSQDKAVISLKDGTVLGELDATYVTRMSVTEKVILALEIVLGIIIILFLLFYLMLIISSKRSKKRIKRKKDMLNGK